MKVVEKEEEEGAILVSEHIKEHVDIESQQQQEVGTLGQVPGRDAE